MSILTYTLMYVGLEVVPDGPLRWEVYMDESAPHFAESLRTLTTTFRPQQTVLWRGTVEALDDDHMAVLVAWHPVKNVVAQAGFGTLLSLAKDTYRIWHFPHELRRVDDPVDKDDETTLHWDFETHDDRVMVQRLLYGLYIVQHKNVRVICLDTSPIAYFDGWVYAEVSFAKISGDVAEAVDLWKQQLGIAGIKTELISSTVAENVLEIITGKRSFLAPAASGDRDTWDIEL